LNGSSGSSSEWADDAPSYPATVDKEGLPMGVDKGVPVRVDKEGVPMGVDDIKELGAMSTGV